MRKMEVPSPRNASLNQMTNGGNCYLTQYTPSREVKALSVHSPGNTVRPMSRVFMPASVAALRPSTPAESLSPAQAGPALRCRCRKVLSSMRMTGATECTVLRSCAMFVTATSVTYFLTDLRPPVCVFVLTRRRSERSDSHPTPLHRLGELRRNSLISRQYLVWPYNSRSDEQQSTDILIY